MSSCTLTDEIALNGELTIIGQTEDMSNLKTITAATGKRHFQVNNAGHTLELWYVKLTGGDVSTQTGTQKYAGSIFIYTNGGKANLYYSEVIW